MIGVARRRRHPFGDIGQPADDVIDRHEVEARARAGGQDMDAARRHQADQSVDVGELANGPIVVAAHDDAEIGSSNFVSFPTKDRHYEWTHGAAN